jgi:hypothetical protein
MDSMTATHFEKLSIGMTVHYVHPNGTHSEASVLHVHNRETGVVVQVFSHGHKIRKRATPCASPANI